MCFNSGAIKCEWQLCIRVSSFFQELWCEAEPAREGFNIIVNYQTPLCELHLVDERVTRPAAPRCILQKGSFATHFLFAFSIKYQNDRKIIISLLLTLFLYFSHFFSRCFINIISSLTLMRLHVNCLKYFWGRSVLLRMQLNSKPHRHSVGVFDLHLQNPPSRVLQAGHTPPPPPSPRISETCLCTESSSSLWTYWFNCVSVWRRVRDLLSSSYCGFVYYFPLHWWGRQTGPSEWSCLAPLKRREEKSQKQKLNHTE